MTASNEFPRTLRVREREPMARHTSFGVGGPADFWVEVRHLDALRTALATAKRLRIPYTVMGHGTNALVADAGIEGVVIYNRCTGFDPNIAVGQVRVESGHSMAKLAGRCAKLGLSGLSFGIGVPGTVGGAIFGNAGAFGSNVGKVVQSALIWRSDNECEVSAPYFNFQYRHSRMQDDRVPSVILAATFRVESANAPILRRELLALARRRRASQPQSKNAGSFFMNPDDDYAGRIIESAGLKGRKVGRAYVSPVHANFLSTEPGGTASDILQLAIEVRQQVAVTTGIRLQPEVRLVGRWNEEARELFT